MEEKEYITRGCICNIKDGEVNIEYKHSCCKHNSYNWLPLTHLPSNEKTDYYEVRFKNDRKNFFKAPKDFYLAEGDIVAVQEEKGHDIGIISLAGDLVLLKMKKRNIKPDRINKIYRKAKPSDIEKWQKTIKIENSTKVKAIKMVNDLKLNMKINDVEFQGDGTKIIFYYTADGRVDFRELIKLYADLFKVRIQMKQIGIRQESSKLGGLGSCGREICCSTWLVDFKTVVTNTAKIQQLSLNPTKLSGVCGKLKCCLNYENDVYIEALKGFPNESIVLKTKKGDATHQKTDIFNKLMWYSYNNDVEAMIPLKQDTVKEIIELNKKNIFPEQLIAYDFEQVEDVKKSIGFENVIGQDSLTRFDTKGSGSRPKKRRSNNNSGNNSNSTNINNKNTKNNTNNSTNTDNVTSGSNNKNSNNSRNRNNNQNRKPRPSNEKKQ